MKRAARLFLAGTLVVLSGFTLSAAAPARDTGPAVSFFSGGLGARAGWVTKEREAIRLLTTKHPASHVHGYAGILVSHVSGRPAVTFPDSSFSTMAPGRPGATLSSPRLVVEFQTGRGTFVGSADLRETTRGSGWEHVDDQKNYPRAAWDVSGGPCGFLSNVRWTTVQKCFVGDLVVSVFVVADAYGFSQLIDDVTVGGKTFSSASDNGSGDNHPAGPRMTTDRALLPKIVFPST